MLDRRVVLEALAASSIAVISTKAFADGEYPTKPIRLIVPFLPGAGVDGAGRISGQGLSEQIGQSVVIYNRAGASGVVGTQAVASSAPDGYTLLFGSAATHGITPALFKNLSYDPVKDFAPIIAIGSTPYYLAVNPSLGIDSVQELIQLAKSKPGELKFASGGNGSSLHLAAELLKYKANIDMVHIPYPSGTASMMDLVAGRVQLGFYPSEIVFPQAKAGSIRIVGVSSLKRTLLAPDIKTLDEQGVEGFDAIGWYGILAPAHTPDPILTKLNDAFAKMLAEPDVRNQFLTTGVEPLGGSRDDFAELIKNELAKWSEIVRVANVQIQ